MNTHPINVHSTQPNWFASRNTPSQIFSADVLKLLKSELGFSGVKVLNIESGIKGVQIQSVLKELNDQTLTKVYSEIGHILDIESDKIQSVLVVVGGLELVKAKMKELEKSLKKINKKEVSKLMKQLGIISEEDVFIIANDGHEMETGGLILVVQKGLKEIEESIKQEENG